MKEFDLEAAIKEMHEERFFHREFAKDLKKFNQVKEMEKEEGLNSLDKSDIIFKLSQKSKNKTILDKFVSGEVSMQEFLHKVDNSRSKKTKAGVKKKPFQSGRSVNQSAILPSRENRKKLSDFFDIPSSNVNGDQTIKDGEEEEHKAKNEVEKCMISFTDILADLEEPLEML